MVAAKNVYVQFVWLVCIHHRRFHDDAIKFKFGGADQSLAVSNDRYVAPLCLISSSRIIGAQRHFEITATDLFLCSSGGNLRSVLLRMPRLLPDEYSLSSSGRVVRAVFESRDDVVLEASTKVALTLRSNLDWEQLMQLGYMGHVMLTLGCTTR